MGLRGVLRLSYMAPSILLLHAQSFAWQTMNYIECIEKNLEWGLTLNLQRFKLNNTVHRDDYNTFCGHLLAINWYFITIITRHNGPNLINHRGWPNNSAAFAEFKFWWLDPIPGNDNSNIDFELFESDSRENSREFFLHLIFFSSTTTEIG